MNYTLKIIAKGQTIQRVQTHSIRRFYNRIRTISWQNRQIKVYLRVSYGGHGNRVTSYNDGIYENEEELYQAMNAFLEN